MRQVPEAQMGVVQSMVQAVIGRDAERRQETRSQNQRAAEKRQTRKCEEGAPLGGGGEASQHVSHGRPEGPNDRGRKDRDRGDRG